jgi:hypothetical protein
MQFTRFTGELDGSREQSFMTACPQLHNALLVAGLAFPCGVE